jgi:indolepyruvate ferredoxin oxidoreductase beta subunit
MNNKNNTKVIISGVGGQGVMLLARMIAYAAKLSGKDIAGSEIHGHGIRGGFTYSIVIYGKNNESPLILKNSADYILSLEILESLRMAKYIKEEGCIITSNKKIIPITYMLKNKRFPTEDEIKNSLSKLTNKVYIVDTENIVKRIGYNVSNSVIYGVFAGFEKINIPLKNFRQAILNEVPRRFQKENLSAFEIGLTISKLLKMKS